MLDWIKKRRAYRLGQQAATAISDEIDARINGRVMPASERFMDVFRQRLAMLWDDPAIEPGVMLRAERDEFEKELANFLGEMRAEINIKTYKWDEVIEATGGREMLDTYIRERMGAVKNAMMQQAETMVIEAFMARYYSGVPKVAADVYGDFNSPDLPPFVLARADLKNFLEHVDELFRPLLSQLREATAGWADTSKQVGAGQIELHYNQFKSASVVAAFQKLLDMTDALKEADDKWRAANPEKAAQIPFDTFSSELSDALAPYLKK